MYKQAQDIQAGDIVFTRYGDVAKVFSTKRQGATIWLVLEGYPAEAWDDNELVALVPRVRDLGHGCTMASLGDTHVLFTPDEGAMIAAATADGRFHRQSITHGYLEGQVHPLTVEVVAHEQ